MIKKKSEMVSRISENMRGGNGPIHFLDLMQPEESLGKLRIACEVTVEKGCSIGRHDHVEEAELYIITSGIATVDDDGVMKKAFPGDIVYTGGGAFHAIANDGDETLRFYALVIN